jgi:hypothetical protein
VPYHVRVAIDLKIHVVGLDDMLVANAYKVTLQSSSR